MLGTLSIRQNRLLGGAPGRLGCLRSSSRLRPRSELLDHVPLLGKERGASTKIMSPGLGTIWAHKSTICASRRSGASPGSVGLPRMDSTPGRRLSAPAMKAWWQRTNVPRRAHAVLA